MLVAWRERVLPDGEPVEIDDVPDGVRFLTLTPVSR